MANDNWPTSVSVPVLRTCRELGPYASLACAIVAQAAEDYMSALHPIKHRDMNTWAKDRMINDVDSFLHSRWFGCLTELDPDYLIELMQTRVLQEAGPTADAEVKQ